MKKYLLLLTLITFPFLAFPQVIVGTGTNETQSIPIEAYYGFSYSQTIYLASEINSSGMITSIAYFYSGTTALPNSDDDIQIWMTESTKTAFASSLDWEPVASMTQVFNGSIPAPTTPGVDEWLTITLDTPFSYGGTDNLIVAVDANEAGYDSSSDDFHCTASSTGRSIYYRSDSTNPDPTSPPSGTLLAYIANITFGGIQPAAEPNCAENLTPVDGTTNLAFECGAAVLLNWNAASSGVAADMYNVYFGTSATPPLVSTSSETSYNAGNLAPNTTYYYQIVPEAAGVASLNCPILTIATGSDTNDAGSGGTNEVYYFANNNNSQGTQGGAFVWDDPVVLGHTEVTSWTSGSDDDGYATVTLPFTYKYYGTDYTDIHIGTNGYVSFGTGFTSTGSSTDLGVTADPDGMIAMAMMDLDDMTDGQIFHGPIDANTYVITWYHYHDYQDASEWITMQLVLQNLPGADNDVFEMRFNQDESSSIPDFLTDAVIGSEGPSGMETEFARYREDGVGGPMFCSPLVIGFAPTEAGVQLPVELTKFSGKAMDRYNMLQWTTATEDNASHMEVEKMYGNTWRPIGSVDAKGFSSSESSYSLADNSPKSEEIYRLKMVDLDGSFQYSEIISLTRKTIADEVSVYPNPFKEDITINIDVTKEQSAAIKVYDISGKLILQNNMQLADGMNKLPINMSNQIEGVYLLQVQLESGMIQKKIVRQ